MEFEWIKNLINIALHIDIYLGTIIRDYGLWTYGILFLVIFCETGLVVTPFLPGDSLLFAAGALSASTGVIDVKILLIVISVAAILEDTVNYSIGHYFGPRVFKENVRFLKREYLDNTHAFYEKYGGKTIIIARFVPIVRTFAPFVAGIGEMSYGKFILYNVVGGIGWALIFIFAGFFFGNLQIVKNNFSLVIIAIIIISVLPGVFAYLKERRLGKNKVK